MIKTDDGRYIVTTNDLVRMLRQCGEHTVENRCEGCAYEHVPGDWIDGQYRNCRDKLMISASCALKDKVNQIEFLLSGAEENE